LTREILLPRLKRSADSLRFETALRGASWPGVMLRLADIDCSKIQDLLPWIAVIDPQAKGRSLNFMRAGAGLASVLGCDPIGMDYLDWVDPAIKGDAFDSAFLMLSRPCGLWQITPVSTMQSKRETVEYTGFPVFDHVNGRGQIMCLIHHKLSPLPRLLSVQHATTWSWIELRNTARA
jgi:hypothetical protein